MGADHKPKARSGSVIWALDPFEADTRPLLSAVHELSRWCARAGLRLLPVHIVSSREEGHGEPARNLDVIEEELRHYLERYELGDHVRPRIIFDASGSRKGEMEALKKMAESEDVRWIAVSSHGKGSVARLVLGSFTERLVHDSRWPVLFLARQPRPERARLGRKALFATEFSPFADEAFERFLPYARALNLDLTILHLLAYPIASFDLGIGSIIPENFYAEQEAGARERASGWLLRAKQAGVKARFVLGEGGSAALSGKAILEEARKEEARLIAVPLFGSVLERLVEGSAAHQIFRSGRFPVWLMGPAFWTGERRQHPRGERALADEGKPASHQ